MKISAAPEGENTGPLKVGVSSYGKLFHNEYRRLHVGQQVIGYGAEEHARKGAQAAAAHDNQVCADLVCRIFNQHAGVSGFGDIFRFDSFRDGSFCFIKSFISRAEVDGLLLSSKLMI